MSEIILVPYRPLFSLFFNYKSSLFILPFTDNVKFSKKMFSLKYAVVNSSK